MPIHRSALLKGAILSLTLLAAGCGEAGVDRVAVHGTVSLDGKPLPAGAIVFEPAGEVKGPAAGGPVVDGRFDIERSQGPVKGRVRVKITSSLDTTTSLDDPLKFSEHRGLPPPEPIPARYNAQTELVVDTNMEKLEFILHSDPAPR